MTLLISIVVGVLLIGLVASLLGRNVRLPSFSLPRPSAPSRLSLVDVALLGTTLALALSNVIETARGIAGQGQMIVLIIFGMAALAILLRIQGTKTIASLLAIVISLWSTWYTHGNGALFLAGGLVGLFVLLSGAAGGFLRR